MKVQLIVVRGKPEGKVIPLAGTKFKIGRGETCHLRPNSEQVSREHAEFTLESSAVIVRDLGSRNGTLVNGKALTTEPYKLKDRDLVQVGPLTFAVSIQDAPALAARPAARAAPAPAKSKPFPDDISTDDIDSWLLGDKANQSADQPTVVYGGDTITITAFKDAQTLAKPPSKPLSVDDDSEYERQTTETEAADEELDENAGDAEEETETAAEEEERKKKKRRSGRTPKKSSWIRPTRSARPRRPRKNRPSPRRPPRLDLTRRRSRTAATRPTTSFAS